MKAEIVLKLGLLFPSLLVAGCISGGPVRSLAVAANNPAVVERDLDGTVTLRSLQTHIVSVWPMNKRFSNATYTLPALYVIVTNGGKEDLKLKPDDIRAYSGDRRVALLSPNALQERLDEEDDAATGRRLSFPAP